MEGYAWQLRNQNILQSWKKTTVKEVLQRIIQGTDIKLSDDIPDIPLPWFSIPNWNGLKVLEYMAEKMLLTVYFDNEVLYAGVEEFKTTALVGNNSAVLQEVKYNIGYNCVLNQPNLKQRLADDNLVQIRIKKRFKSGKHVVYEAGDNNGQAHDKTISFIEDEKSLQGIADARLKRLKYNGFEGKITGFLQPIVNRDGKRS